MSTKKEERAEKNRESSKRHYEKNKELLREKARNRYREKVKNEGRENRPRGRPRKYKTIEESQMAKKDYDRIQYYSQMIDNGLVPDIEKMDDDQRKCLMISLLKNQKRQRRKKIGGNFNSKDEINDSNTGQVIPKKLKLPPLEKYFSDE